MSALAQIQSEVLAAICDVKKPIPPFIEAGADEERRATRFNIYRNNFYVAVINVLRERFPVTERIVGEDFFKATARTFIEETPPIGQSNLKFGQDFPSFLSDFPHCADLPYLPDVSRLEWARFKSAIAPDMPNVTSQQFSEVDPARAGLIHFEKRAACHMVSSPFPIYDIWRTNHEDDVVKTLNHSTQGQSVLISRTPLGIEVHQVSSASYDLMALLFTGTPLGQAYERVNDQLTQDELSETLSLLLSKNAVTALHIPEFAKA